MAYGNKKHSGKFIKRTIAIYSVAFRMSMKDELELKTNYHRAVDVQTISN